MHDLSHLGLKYSLTKIWFMYLLHWTVSFCLYIKGESCTLHILNTLLWHSDSQYGWLESLSDYHLLTSPFLCNRESETVSPSLSSSRLKTFSSVSLILEQLGQSLLRNQKLPPCEVWKSLCRVIVWVLISKQKRHKHLACGSYCGLSLPSFLFRCLPY